jgi:hypothetical protein
LILVLGPSVLIRCQWEHARGDQKAAEAVTDDPSSALWNQGRGCSTSLGR